tara:strand:+ start:762 stop:1151 length:390 start_codon:yes stop_codon:yes gene_type:complete
MIKNLFVYGTLKKGHRLSGILDGQKFKGEYKTAPDFDILDYADGSFPIVIPKENGYSIKGELYEVNEDVADFTDKLEIGAGYTPVQVKLIPDDIESTIYVYTEEPDINLSDNYIVIKDNIKEWKHGRIW